MRVDRIVLHIGTEKTGTSSIQHFLSGNRAALGADGIVYPLFTGPNGGSQWGFVAAVARRPWKSDIGARLEIRDQASASVYRKRLIDAIDQELAACPDRHTLLVSCEHFHSRLRKPGRVRALQKLLSRWSDKVEVILYLRRQDRVAVSLYSTRLKSGNPTPEVFPAIEGEQLPYYYDYECVYDTWCQVFGEEAVQACLYEQQADAEAGLIEDFCARVGIDITGKEFPRRVNQSLSEAGVLMLQELNQQWPRKPLSGPDPSREHLVARISRENPGRSYPATRAEAQAFYAHFTAGNARLAQRIFPGLGGEMFTGDFADYPATAPKESSGMRKQVRRRIKAWKALSATEQAGGVHRRLRSVRQQLERASAQLSSFVYRSASGPNGVRTGEMVKLPPVFLHVGLPKTATTTLQNSLFSHHSGICYLGKRSAWPAERHCYSDEIYAVLRPLFWQRSEPIRPHSLRSVLHAHSRQMGSEKPILGSWEGLGITPPMKFQQILRDAQDAMGDVRVIFTLRNPLKRLPSAYLHALKACAKLGTHHSLPAGRVFLPFDDWLDGAHRGIGKHDFRFDFDKNLRFATEFLGRDKVGVFLFEDMVEDRKAFFASVLRFMGIDHTEEEAIEDKHLNQALNAVQVDFLKTIDASDEERTQWLALPPRERTRHMDKLRDSGGDNKYGVVMTEAQRQLIADRSRSINRWLVEAYDLDLERHQYPL